MGIIDWQELALKKDKEIATLKSILREIVQKPPAPIVRDVYDGNNNLYMTVEMDEEQITLRFIDVPYQRVRFDLRALPRLIEIFKELELVVKDRKNV